MKTIRLFTILAYLVLILFSCNKKPIQKEKESIKTINTNQKNEVDIFLESQSNNKQLSAEKEWKIKAERILKMKEGESYTVNNPKKSKKMKRTDVERYWLDPDNYKESKSKIKFENNEQWRKEAFKVSLKYIQKAIGKIKNCRVTRQGIYQHHLVKYMGNRGFLVKSYCEFDCKQDYNNPTNFWVEVYYQGKNSWSGEIVKNQFVD